jgi:hypothetical protein
MGRRVHRLKDIKVGEISLVDAPANPGALTVLFKRHDLSEEAEGMSANSRDEGMAKRDDVLVQVAKAVCEGAAGFGDITAANYYDVIKRGAEAGRQAGETPEQARTRYMKTGPGRMLRQASLVSAGPDHRTSPPTPIPPDPGRAGPASKEIHDRAAALVLNESRGGAINAVTRAGRLASARTRIRAEFPELASAEALEQKGA